MSEPDVILFSRTEDGHRGAYIRFIASHLSAESRPASALLGVRQPVIFLLIEDSFAFYVLTALVRALMGRRTAGLLFRPKPALESHTLKLRGKRTVLRLLRRIPLCQTLTILPFSVDPRFAQIADSWIYDFQLWDLSATERNNVEVKRAQREHADPSTLIGQISVAAKGRPVVCAVGRQDRDKGFDVFAQAFATHASIRERFLFAFGGKVAKNLTPELAAYEKAEGFATNRRIEDAELLDLYSASDLVWCHYALGYDQASGILGRAAQLGMPAIVREGSLVHAMCRSEGIPHIAFDASRPEMLTEVSIAANPAAGAALAERFAAQSLVALRQALGLPSL
jgi:glycosyltransferase involved in cell wall biosynthesis